jgi:RimJ/RimL family protein N-acetyltransferase
MLPEVITTERLTLRPWAFGDVSDVVLFADDREWSRYLPISYPYGESDARQFIATQVLLNREEHPSWAIEHEGRVIGGINVRLLSSLRIAELGYSIARTCWRRGFATEAARAIVDATFLACPSIVRVRATADARNVASIRVLEKIPMKREGVLRSDRFIRDEPIDVVWCGVLRDEWQSRRARGQG